MSGGHSAESGGGDHHGGSGKLGGEIKKSLIDLLNPIKAADKELAGPLAHVSSNMVGGFGNLMKRMAHLGTDKDGEGGSHSDHSGGDHGHH